MDLLSCKRARTNTVSAVLATSEIPRHQLNYVSIITGSLPPHIAKQFDEDWTIRNSRKSQFKGVGDMWNNTRRILESFYEPFNAEVSRLLENEDIFWNSE